MRLLTRHPVPPNPKDKRMADAALIAQLRADVLEAERVAEILENETLKGVFARLEAEAISDWRSSEDYHKSLESDAWLRLRAVESLKGALESIVNTGRMAAQELERVKRGQS
jgi:hypothetical protein